MLTAMDDEYFALLNLHNSFGFPQDTISLSLYPSNYAWHPADSSTLGEAVPDFISDHGTPSSPLSSLMTPTDPPSGAFIFPPSYPYTTPFPSECWVPSYPNSTCMPSVNAAHIHTPPHLPTWQANANRSPVPSWGTVASPAVDGLGMNEPLYPRFPETANRQRNTVDGSNTTTGPKRNKRSPKRQAPYTVDNDSEGATNSNLLSQQAFLSERPGYGYDKAQKCTTKRPKKKKSHRTPEQQRAGPSVNPDSQIHVQKRMHPRTTTSVEAPRDAPPELTCIRAIRKHAGSNWNRSTVNCAFVNASSEHFEEQKK